MRGLTTSRSPTHKAAAQQQPTEHATPGEAAWGVFLELVLEAMETCFRDGTWVPGKGLAGVSDSLNETLIHDKKKE